MLSRRRLLETSTLALIAAGLSPVSPALAQGVFDAGELLKPGVLPEMSMGKADAPVTVIEYASMTCGHCAHFHETVFPHLKEKYIDAGKVRFIYREFPLDALAAAASMLSRCAPGDRYFEMTGLFYAKQKDWIRADDPVEGLFSIAKQSGFTRETFKTCLTDQKLLDGITANRTRGSEAFKIDGTPTFFVNGKKIVGISTVAEMDEALAPLLKG
ncbi:MAG: DsbA family protein [Hyphomicrobiales bacterium]|nr:DsbA family protein [Hyphomicrobiales bacterium]